jgi:hypothetical protein
MLDINGRGTQATTDIVITARIPGMSSAETKQKEQQDQHKRELEHQ